MLVGPGDPLARPPKAVMGLQGEYFQPKENDKRMGERPLNTFRTAQRERAEMPQEAQVEKFRGNRPMNVFMPNLSKKGLREDKRLNEASFSGFDMIDKEQFLEIALNSIQIPDDTLSLISKKLKDR